MFRLLLFSFVCSTSLAFDICDIPNTKLAIGIDSAIMTVGNHGCKHTKQLFGLDDAALERKNQKPNVDEELTINYESSDGEKISYKINDAAKEIPKAEFYDSKQLIYIYIHCYGDSEETVAPLRKAYYNIRKSNVLSVGTGDLIKSNYLLATSYSYFIGQKLGSVLAEMAEDGVKGSHFHLIGYGLGAHIAGVAGKTYLNTTGVLLGRITGLDPIGLCFGLVNNDMKLQPTDAYFVDVIHTSAGRIGTDEDLGQVNFSPNGGRVQPGCYTNECSHRRSMDYFVESVREIPNIVTHSFFSVAAADYNTFKKTASFSNYNHMGSFARRGAKNYFLQTASSSPYALGVAGTQYNATNCIFPKIRNFIQSVTP